MKRLAAIGALAAAVVALVVLLPASESSGPEPIAFGRDTCARCRMHISQPGYAGELRDRERRLSKYDDLGCMLVALWRLHEEIPEAWVEDHAGAGFVSLLTAALVRGEGLGTPMGYGVVAFADPQAAERFARERGGERVTLEQLLEDKARFAPHHEHAEADR